LSRDVVHLKTTEQFGLSIGKRPKETGVIE